MISELTKDIIKEEIVKSITKRVPTGAVDLNILAFQKGIELFKNSNIKGGFH